MIINSLKIVFFLVVLTLNVACESEQVESKATLSAADKNSISWWKARHEQILTADHSNVELVFIGDSITQNWEHIDFGYGIWQQNFEHFALNLGFSSDKIQNVLWRLNNGEIDNVSPAVTVLLVGTNNLSSNTAIEIIEGVKEVIQTINRKLPSSRLIVYRIFPRTDVSELIQQKAKEIDAEISKYAAAGNFEYVDINEQFIDAQGNIPKSIMPDGLHPSEEGYEIWANDINYYLPN